MPDRQKHEGHEALQQKKMQQRAEALRQQAPAGSSSAGQGDNSTGNINVNKTGETMFDIVVAHMHWLHAMHKGCRL